MSKVVIVGAGHGAGQCVATLVQKEYAGRICLIGDESWYPYQRPPLSKKFLAGELPAERLFFKPRRFYDDPRIAVRLDTRVEAIDREHKRLLVSNGDPVKYDTLVLATGSRPRELPVAGAELAGVHFLRGIDDVTAIRDDMENAAKMIIVGAGYIGLEVAAVASASGLDVTVVEMADRVMSRVVSPAVSSFFEAEHAAHGVDLKLSSTVSAIVGNGRASGVALGSGETVAGDLVVIGIGIVPNTELATEAGLDVRDGIVVDDRCRTRDPDIYAIGDCTNHPNAILDTSLRLESVHNALEQAKTAASNICGTETTYADVPWFWSDQYDLKLQIAGISQGYDTVLLRGDPADRAFSCLYLRDGRLIAVDAINRPRDFMQSKALIASKVIVPPATLGDAAIQLKDMLD